MKIKLSNKPSDKKQKSKHLTKLDTDLNSLIKRAAFLYVESGGIIPPSEMVAIDELEKLDIENPTDDAELADEFDHIIVLASKKIKKIRAEMDIYHREVQTGELDGKEMMNKKTEIRLMMKLVRDNDLASLEKHLQANNLFTFKKKPNKEVEDVQFTKRKELIETVRLSLEWCSKNLDNSGESMLKSYTSYAPGSSKSRRHEEDTSKDCPEIDISDSLIKLQKIKSNHEKMLEPFRDNLIQLGEMNKELMALAERKNVLLDVIIDKTEEQNAKLDDINHTLTKATKKTYISCKLMCAALGCFLIVAMIMIFTFLVDHSVKVVGE